MRAVAYKQPGAIDRSDALLDIELPEPVARGRDLLVQIKAVSVNPVDTKVRGGSGPIHADWRVLGWDAAGIVRAIGPDVSGFMPGDEVYYAGSIGRDGTNAELHLVDERIVGKKPVSLDWAEAAALPLTAITAWEALFERLCVRDPVSGAGLAVLIIGGAGGVGSMAIQLARQVAGLTVIATASRPETQAWAREMGAHHVIDHRLSLAEQIADLGIGAPAFVLSTTHSDQHIEQIAELIAPQGRFALIDDPKTLDISLLKRKSVSIHWEFMFTRSMFETSDMAEQGKLLSAIAKLVDAGEVRTTLTERLTPINSTNIKRAHKTLESSTARGKIVVEGWK